MAKRIYLHIGTHKTGTTSLQRFLLDHVNYLSRKGFALYRGEFQDVNHTELHLATMRYERDSFAKLGFCRHLTIDAAFTRQVIERVHSFIDSCPEPRIIFTSEALSWLRYEDEMDRLRAILGDGTNETTVVLYLRNRADYLRSYISQLYKVKGRMPALDRRSVLYVEPDTWLTDYDSLIALYQRAFGTPNVVVVDYDDEMQKVGNVIPSFLRVLGLDSADELDVTSYFLNTTSPADRRKPLRGVRRWIERARRGWLERQRGRAA